MAGGSRGRGTDASAGSEQPHDPGRDRHPVHRLLDGIVALVKAIQENDQDRIQTAILRLSSSHRIFRPLAFLVGAFVLLYDGVRLLVSNWRLMLVQILPAMWIWLAMFDLKAHVLHGKSFHVLRGPILIPIALVITSITIACYFLNVVFAFAITQPERPPAVRRAFEQARTRLVPVAISGGVIGLLLAYSTTVVTRYGHPWYALCLGAVVAIMMVTYVAVPTRLIGVRPASSKRDKLFATAVGGTVGATVCTPPYLLGRVGLLMLGSKVLLIPGIFVFAVGITLQMGATGAVRAIKMTAKLKDPDVVGSAAPAPDAQSAAVT